MSLGYQKSRCHVASDRRVIGRLALHAAWMKRYQDQGMTREAASTAAMKKVAAGAAPPRS